MALPKLSADLNNISKLDNYPPDDVGMTPALLKARFDQSGNDIKAYINETLIPALESGQIQSFAQSSGDGSPGTRDTYTLTYQDGSSASFTVYNGMDGPSGQRGEQGLPGVVYQTDEPDRAVVWINPSEDSEVLVAATPTQNGYMLASDKTKLDGIEAGAQVNSTIDEVLSAASENAVQNKAVTAGIDALNGSMNELATDVSSITEWALTVIGLPSMAGHAGQLLTTDGTAASWGNTVQANAADQVGLKIVGSVGQTENLQQWLSSGGSLLARVASNGSILATYYALNSTTLGVISAYGNNSANVFPSQNGTIISRNIADDNAALTAEQQNAAATGYIQKWVSNGITRASISYFGTQVINGWYVTPSGMYHSGGVENAYVNLAATGVSIRRNVADANPALVVDQVNAGSTGNIAEFKWAGDLKSFVSRVGVFYGTAVCATGGSTSAYMALASTGVTISRNIADANPALVIDQVNAGSTGNILDLRFGGVSKAKVDADGRLSAATLISSGNYIRISSPITPESASASGSQGMIRWDANYLYVCTATNTWKRAALTTW